MVDRRPAGQAPSAKAAMISLQELLSFNVPNGIAPAKPLTGRDD
jgi:hypothetical protein